MKNAVKDQFVQLLPHSRIIRAAHNNAFLNTPGFPKVAVAYDFILHAVILCVDAGSQHKYTIRQLCPVCLSAGHQTIFILQTAPTVTQLAEAGILNHLHPS